MRHTQNAGLSALLLLVVLATPFAGLMAQETEPAPEEPTELELLVEEVATMDEAALLEKIEQLSAEVEAADEAAAATVEALKVSPDDADAKTAVDAAQDVLDGATDKLAAVCDAAKEQDMDVSGALALLIRVRGIDATTLDTGALTTLVEEWLEQGRVWVVENGPGIIIRAVAFLLVLIVFWFLSRIAGRLTFKAMSSSRLKMTDLLRQFFGGLASKLVLFVGFLFAFRTIGVDLGPVLAGVGIIGFVVGFALQETLGNFAAGIMILMYRPFDVGDLIETGGTLGKVMDLTLVSTTLNSLDNQKVIIPNGKIWGGTIVNVTARPTRRVDLVVGISYGDDIGKALTVIQDVMDKHEKVLSNPAPEVAVLGLGDSSVDLRVRPWCSTADYWDVASQILMQVKMRLDEEGISIPFPQRDVHMIAPAPAS